MDSKKNNLLIYTYSELVASEWDYVKNERDGIYVNKVTCGSGLKAWWKCHKCHGSYQMAVYHKTRGRGCPYCSGHKVLKGFNDLASQHSDLVRNEWDYEKNSRNGLRPDEITSYVNRKAWWRCSDYKHSYQSTINNRVKGSGCPFCAGKKVLKGFNDLQSKYTELIENEWDWDRNSRNGLKPDEITASSSAKAWWRCNTCNGSYESTICNRTSGYGCPYCAGKKILQGYNDLASCYPELVASEWDYERNSRNGLQPDEITSHANIKTNWHCNACNGHYEMAVYDKTRGIGCPYCSSQRVLKGFNDLQTKCPDLITLEWDWIRNNANGIYPDELTSGSDVKAHWKCSECSHEWVASVNSRTGNMKSGCPSCSHRISKQENQVAEFITDYLCEHADRIFTIYRSITFNSIFSDMNIACNDEQLCSHMRKELDIYIPELGFAVEYDGDYWHDDKRMIERCGLTNDEAHSIKQQLCKQAGIKLLFITEHDWLHDTEHVKNTMITLLNEKIKYGKPLKIFNFPTNL